MNRVLVCPVCGKGEFALYLMAKDWHYGNSGEYELDECKSCGLVFLNPMYTEDELAEFYPQDDYYAYKMDLESPESKNRFRERLRKILPFIAHNKEEKKYFPVGRILDIGCGTGWNLFQYKKRGWSVAGVEPSEKAARIGNASDLNIFHGTL